MNATSERDGACLEEDRVQLRVFHDGQLAYDARVHPS